MPRLHRGCRHARSTARKSGRINRPFHLRRCFGNLKVEPSSRRILYTALIQRCRKNCPEKLAGHLGDGITLAEVTKPARTSKTGRRFWGHDGECQVRRGRVRALRWPCRRDDEIPIGLRTLLAGMAVVDDLKGRKRKTVNAMVKKGHSNEKAEEVAAADEMEIAQGIQRLQLGQVMSWA
ncbi:hypothetical protein GJ744_009313 [Endocarpon pusillum]|uniref:Uncharacterized protein n=1 Tax=Endocarpon pusillum TaxID=364733 RepID=A0A8H7AI58_9EURO|nr:hypothetical protein GJ744_009313 [Endocarpon pusillum]